MSTTRLSPQVAIIILNWNNAGDTLACLRSVVGLDDPPAHILVVDNGSDDDSAARIRAAHPHIEIIETGANLGYAGGNNQGIRHALQRGVELICVLNNDVIVAQDFLNPLIDALSSSPGIGVATPMIVDHSNDGLVWALGASLDRFNGRVERLFAGQVAEKCRDKGWFDVDIAPGAAFLAKREIFERVGLLNEQYFLYYEEADWCLQVRGAGYRILAVPASFVRHKVSSALGISSPATSYYMTRNHLLLISKHWSGSKRAYLLARVVVRELIAALAFTLKPHRGNRLSNRNARLLGLRDALLGRWGAMGADVAASLRSGKAHRP